MIKNGKTQNERLIELRKEAISQKKSLMNSIDHEHKLINSPLSFDNKKLK